MPLEAAADALCYDGEREIVRRALSSIFDRGQSRLLIDLNAVAYIDSSGMGTLIAAMKLRLAAPPDLTNDGRS